MEALHSRCKTYRVKSRSKLEAIRLLIASNLRILDIDAEHREGRAPSDSTVDLSKLAVVSDRTVLVPPYYSLEASTDLFDLQRNVTSLHLYLYLPKMEIELNREGIKLKSVLSSVELHEQCLAVTKSSRVLVETGAVAGVEHVLLNVPLASEAKLVECLNSIQCKHRTLQTTANHANEGEYNAVRPVVMTMKRSLNKTGFHRELVTQIRLSNANVSTMLYTVEVHWHSYQKFAVIYCFCGYDEEFRTYQSNSDNRVHLLCSTIDSIIFSSTYISIVPIKFTANIQYLCDWCFLRDASAAVLDAPVWCTSFDLKTNNDNFAVWSSLNRCVKIRFSSTLFSRRLKMIH